MRYPASEKLEIIRTVETSPLPVRRTLAQVGIPKSTFYAWLDRYVAGGLDALEDRKPRPERVWNRIGDDVRQKVIAFALDQPELSPREIAVAGSVESPVARAVLAPFTPNTVVAVGPAEGVPLLEGKEPVAGKPAVYVCERFVCRAPVTDAEALDVP